MKGGQFRKSGSKKPTNVILPTVVEKCNRCGTIQDRHAKNCPNHPRNQPSKEEDES